MDQISLENWVVMHLGLIFMITCAQILVVYALSDASNPTPGLGMYTVYFMAALLGWLAFALQQGSDIPMAVDVPSVASILNSYILFLAAGQRAGINTGRFLLGLICLFSCLSVFFSAATTDVCSANGDRQLFLRWNRSTLWMAELEQTQRG